MENLFNFLFPQECKFCNKPGASFCYSCLQKCACIEEQLCIVCNSPCLHGFTHQECLISDFGVPVRVISVFDYSSYVRDCIRKSKYGSMEFVMLKSLTRYALTLLSKQEVEFGNSTVVVPVPINNAKKRERGFNQSLIIAEIFARGFGLDYSSNFTQRKQRTQPQSGLSREERFKNISGAFSCSSGVKGKSILLVDDICTTGATLLELSRVVYSAGAKSVYCFTLAKRL